MWSVFRALLFAGCLAAGSWLGLGKPSFDAMRGLAARATAGAKAHMSGSAPGDAKAEPDVAPEANEDAASGPSFAPFQHDLVGIPSMRLWPELNPEASIPKAWMVAEGPAYKPGNGRRLVTLTFDDGPFPETTPSVLRLLAKHRVHASFFVIGRYLDGDSDRAVRSREVLKEVAAAGHLIGNHTHDHVLLTSVTHTQVLEQIDHGAASIERVTGKRPILFRPPFGTLDDFGQEAVRERGLDLLLWSVEKQDMQRADSHEVFRELVSQIDYKEGGVVLLHDIRRTSVDALRELLDWLQLHQWDPEKPSKVGYEIVDLPTYLREVAASPLPYATRDELERAREAAMGARAARRPRAISRRNAHAGDSGAADKRGASRAAAPLD
jgi:peptidoglycan/xylan/chitin deacetylase (PgdA/CDA1 family)